MQTKRYIYSISVIIFGILLLISCRKEVTHIDSFSSIGRVFPLKGSQHIAGAIKTPDDGYLIWGNTDAGAHGKQDGFLLRLDSEFNPLWYNTYGGFSDDYIESAAFDKQGNIIAGGTSTSFGVSIDTNSVTVNPSLYAIYVTGNGNLLWQKTYNGNPGKPNLKNTLSKVLVLPDQNFILVGTTNNHLQQTVTSSFFVPNAFIQCVTQTGDTLWHSNYNYYDQIIPIPDIAIGYRGSNAVLSPDGFIQMLVTSGTNEEKYFPFSLIKISPNSTTGYNKFISRVPLKEFNAFNNVSSIEFNISNLNFFLSMQLIDSTKETYLIAGQKEMFVYNNNGMVITRKKINESSSIDDMLYKNGLAYFASPENITKAGIDGTIIWKNEFFSNFKIERMKGLFVENDKSISVFCNYKNTMKEMDIALLRLTENGQLIVK